MTDAIETFLDRAGYTFRYSFEHMNRLEWALILLLLMFCQILAVYLWAVMRRKLLAYDRHSQEMSNQMSWRKR